MNMSALSNNPIKKYKVKNSSVEYYVRKYLNWDRYKILGTILTVILVVTMIVVSIMTFGAAAVTIAMAATAVMGAMSFPGWATSKLKEFLYRVLRHFD